MPGLKKIRKEKTAKYKIVDGEVFKVDLVGRTATGDVFLEQRSEDEDENKKPKRLRPMPLSEYRAKRQEATGDDKVVTISSDPSVTEVKDSEHTRVAKAQLRADANPDSNPEDQLDAPSLESVASAEERTEERNMAGMQEFMDQLGGVLENVASATENLNTTVERINSAFPQAEGTQRSDGEEDPPVADPSAEPETQDPADATPPPAVEPESDQETPEENPSTPDSASSEDVSDVASERQSGNPDPTPAPTADIQVPDAFMSVLTRMEGAVGSLTKTVKSINSNVEGLGERMAEVEREVSTPNAEDQDETEEIETEREEPRLWGSVFAQ